MSRWESRIRRPVEHLAGQLQGIRSATTSAATVMTIRATWPAGSASLGQVARVTQQGDRVIVTPFDRELVPVIVRALVEAKQSAYALDPTRIAVSIPAMSVEQRAAILRQVKDLAEEARVAVRQIRQDIRKQLAAAGKRSDRVVQELTDAAIAEIDRLMKGKLQELAGDEGGARDRGPLLDPLRILKRGSNSPCGSRAGCRGRPPCSSSPSCRRGPTRSSTRP
jgi:ribosome recycling factor